METFTYLKGFSENLQYQGQKQKSLDDLDEGLLDSPIVGIIRGLNRLPHCFTLQSCYGHFVYEGQNNIHNLCALPAEEIQSAVEYRIAYLALCLENSEPGRRLFEALNGMTHIDPDNIQFGCAEWFWNRQVNSYILQVEPARFKSKDTALINFKEALRVESVRNALFIRLNEMF